MAVTIRLSDADAKAPRDRAEHEGTSVQEVAEQSRLLAALLYAPGDLG